MHIRPEEALFQLNVGRTLVMGYMENFCVSLSGEQSALV